MNAGGGEAPEAPIRALHAVGGVVAPRRGKGPFTGLQGGEEGGKGHVTHEFLPLSYFHRGSDRMEGPGGGKKIP